MQKYFIYLFVGVFAIFSVVQGVSLFEEYHNNRLNEPERMMVDFDPQKLYEFHFSASSENLMEYVEELKELSDTYNADLFLKPYHKLQEEEDEKKDSAPNLTYIYSKNPSLLPDYTFSDKQIDWSATGNRGYEWPYKEDVGRINQITNQLPGHFHGKDLGFYPLSTIEKRNETQGEVFCSGHFHSEHLQDIYAFLSKQSNLEYGLIPLDHYQKGVNRPTDEHDTGPPYFVSFILLASILVLVLSVYSLKIVQATRAIGIRKIHGQGRGLISRKLFLKSDQRIVFLFLGLVVLSSLLTIKYLNALTLRFLMILMILVLSFLLTIVLVHLIARFYIQKIRPAVATKKSVSLSSFLSLGFILKMILAFLLVSQLFITIPLLTDVYYRYRAKTIYPEVLRLEIHKEWLVGKTAEEKQISADNILKIWDKEISRLHGIKMVSSQKGSFLVTGDTEGNIIVTEIEDSLVFSTFHLLQENQIFDISGKRIYLAKPPLDTLILLPPGKSRKDVKLYEDIKGVPRTIRSKQSVVLIDGQKVVNPMIIIPSLEEAKNHRIELLPNLEHLKEEMSRAFDKESVPSSWYSYEKVIPSAMEVSEQTVVAKNIVMSLFMLVSFIALSYHNVYVFIQNRKRKLHLQYLHGKPFYERYLPMALLAILPYLLAFGISSFSPEILERLVLVHRSTSFFKVDISRQTMMGLYGSLLLFDLLLHWMMIKKIQIRSVGFLKGER